MAVGNPLGFDDTVSVGVVSSLKRDLPAWPKRLVNAIQTDAAIKSRKFSGGALCDQHGNLVGINSAIASGNGGSVGIGFAIPVDRVKTVVNDIVKYGYARYPSLGLGYRRDWTGFFWRPPKPTTDRPDDRIRQRSNARHHRHHRQRTRRASRDQAVRRVALDRRRAHRHRIRYQQGPFFQETGGYGSDQMVVEGANQDRAD